MLCGSRRKPLLAAVIATAAIAVLPAFAHAATVVVPTQLHSLYRCVAKDPHAATPPPATARPADSPLPQIVAKPLCPTGQVPHTTAGDEPKAPPPGMKLTAAAQAAYQARYGKQPLTAAQPDMINQFGAYYGYVVGSAFYSASDAAYEWDGDITNEAPTINTAETNTHSIAQVWALDTTPSPTYSDVELGWNVDRGLYGDTATHIFTFSFDDGVPGCYNGTCPTGGEGGFVQVNSSVFPGAVINNAGQPPSASQFLVHEDSAGNWWIRWEGFDIGYYPPSAYPRYHPASITLGQGGGEVASVSSATSCTDMGNGQFGSSGAGAYVDQLWSASNSGVLNPALGFTVSDPSAWNNGPGRVANGFAFGGPGYC